MPADLAAQYQNYTRADMSKLRSVGCGVLPTPLELGVRDTVRAMTGPSSFAPSPPAPSRLRTHVDAPRKTA